MAQVQYDDASAPEAALAIPLFAGGFVNMRKPLRRLVESVVNGVMSAGADKLCGATGNGRNGSRSRSLVMRVGTLTHGMPKPGPGGFFPGDVIERLQEVDMAIETAASEMCATGTSMRKNSGHPSLLPRCCDHQCRQQCSLLRLA